MNLVILRGNLTRDIELKFTPSGTAVARMGLAMNRKWRDKQTNELKEDVTFQEVVIWGKTAQTAQQYLNKGRSVLIEGRLQTESWIDKQTQQKRSRNVVVCERLELLPSRDGGTKPATAAAPAQIPAQQSQGGAAPIEAPAAEEPGAIEFDENGLPF